MFDLVFDLLNIVQCSALLDHGPDVAANLAHFLQSPPRLSPSLLQMSLELVHTHGGLQLSVRALAQDYALRIRVRPGYVSLMTQTCFLSELLEHCEMLGCGSYLAFDQD